jgi:cell division protein FtsN
MECKSRPAQKKRTKKFIISKFLPKIPNFSTLLFGILIGIFASCLTVFMFATSDITLKIPTVRQANGKTQILAPVKQEIVAAKEKHQPHFDFYTELAKTEPTPVLDLKSKPKTIHGYLVQAGSFRRTADADALKAKLTLNGYAAKVEPIKQRDGEVWQRVILGTFKTEQNAKALQQQLKILEIESVLVLKYAD